MPHNARHGNHMGLYEALPATFLCLPKKFSNRSMFPHDTHGKLLPSSRSHRTVNYVLACDSSKPSYMMLALCFIQNHGQNHRILDLLCGEEFAKFLVRFTHKIADCETLTLHIP